VNCSNVKTLGNGSGRSKFFILEEIKSRLNSRNACYNSIQKLGFLSPVQECKTFIYKLVILHLVSCGCETYSFALRVFENRVLRRIFGSKIGVENVMGNWR
jgi:hypothetical protein